MTEKQIMRVGLRLFGLLLLWRAFTGVFAFAALGVMTSDFSVGKAVAARLIDVGYLAVSGLVVLLLASAITQLFYGKAD